MPPRHQMYGPGYYKGQRRERSLSEQFGIDPGDPDIAGILRALADLRLYGFDLEDPEIVQRAIARARQAGEQLRRGEKLREDRRTLRDYIANPHDDPEDETVYYMRIGNRVKIGYTTNLELRLSSINPEELLVTEAGGRLTEKRRHRQFSDLRTNGEWFRYEGPLAEHIDELRRAETEADDQPTAEAQ